MSRPVPEAAPLVGVVLSFGFVLFGFLFSANHLATALGGVVLLYPFVLFGVARSDSPDDVFLPDAVLAAGFLGGAAVAVYGVADGQPLFGAFVAGVVAVPPALYHARFGDRVNPLGPDWTLAAGLLLVAGLFAYGAVRSPLLAAGTSIVIGLGAVDYRRQRGGRAARRARSLAMGGCFVGAFVAFGLLAAVGRPSTGLAAAVVLATLGAFVALGAELP